jgi:hypothetical protein
MRHLLIMLLLAAAPAIGFGQAATKPEGGATKPEAVTTKPEGTATKAEGEVVQEIAKCMVEGPPRDWERLYMIIELPEAGAPSGRVRYMAQSDFSPDPVAYKPCDPSRPAQLLMDARENQAAERRGWTGARLVIHRSGRFDLNYDFPR